MEDTIIIKYNKIKIDNIKLENNNLYYNNNKFLIQTPIFNDYDIINYNSSKYIRLKFNNTKKTHDTFLTFIYDLENKINTLFKVKSLIITDIQNIKYVNIKIMENSLFFNIEKKNIKKLNSNKISLLIEICIEKYNYSLDVNQVLQVN